MGLLRKTASFLIIANLALAPLSVNAQNLRPEDKAAINNLETKLDPSAFSVVVDKDGKGAYVYSKETKEAVAYLPFRSQAELRKFSPKLLNRRLSAEMNKVKGAHNQAWSHSLHNLPLESGVFALAMGAVVATQMFSHYAQNPVGMAQHIEHQMSPIGIAGFYTFMYSQGVTANLLQMYLHNPAYRHMIPYLGMAVGAFVQSYLSEILSDPNVFACGKLMAGGKLNQRDSDAGVEQDPCAKAYEYLVVNKKIWEFAPGIVSMLASSALAGTAQSLAAKAVTKVAPLLPRISGFDIATFLVPGGMEVKGLRLLLVKGLQIYLFVSIDHFLSSKINFVWKSTTDGQGLADLNNRLVQNIFEQKRNQWTGDNKEILTNVKDLHKKSSAWRMMNLSDIYEAHQNWAQSLEGLTGMYTASYNFYNSFVNETRASQKSPNGLLNVAYPLNGVIAKGLAEDKQDLYFTNPAFIQSMQVDTVTDAVGAIDSLLASTRPVAQGWFEVEKQNLGQIRQLLNDDDLTKKAQGLNLLNKEIERALQTSANPDYLTFLQQIYSALGQPQPLLEPGRGFLSTYEQAPLTGISIKGLSQPKVNGQFQTDHMTDYLLMQMACGPDAEKGENSISNVKGFPGIFLPPQLKLASDDFNTECFASGALESSMIYSYQVHVAGRNYIGFLDYLKNNIRPSVLGQETSGFSDWWQKTTESQMQSAFKTYQASYDEIVATLVGRIFHSETKSRADMTVVEKAWAKASSLFTVEDSAFNAGPMSNTAITSLYQEARTYQLILGELLKDSYQAQNKMALPASYFMTTMEPAINFTQDEVNRSNRVFNRQKRQEGLYPSIPLLALLGRSSTLEFDRLAQPFVQNLQGASVAKPKGYRLKIQDELENEMNKLSDLLKSIKVVKVDGHTAVQSTLENDQLDSQLTQIQITLNKFKNILGAADEPNDHLFNQVAASTDQNLVPVDTKVSVTQLNQDLKTSQAQIKILETVLSAGSAASRIQSREQWSDLLSNSKAALANMAKLQLSEGEAAFQFDSEMKAAVDGITELEKLISSTTRTREFPTLWMKHIAKTRASLNKLTAAFGNGIEATTALLKLSAEQKQLANTLIQNLRALTQEMQMYGSIANAVSWDKIRNLKRANSEQSALENETQKKLKQIRSMSILGQH